MCSTVAEVAKEAGTSPHPHPQPAPPLHSLLPRLLPHPHTLPLRHKGVLGMTRRNHKYLATPSMHHCPEILPLGVGGTVGQGLVILKEEEFREGAFKC